MTIVNHWGKFVDSNEPVTGVLSVNSINWEYLDDDICLICEEWSEEIAEMQDCPECENLLDEDGNCPECGWSKERQYDFMECDSSHEKIIGDWKKGEDGKYDVDKDGEFAGIIRESTIQVVWSKTIAKNKKLTSPCFPGQVDLDSDDGDFQGYTLPEYLIYNREEFWSKK